jgi:hypothetical protein
VSESDWDIVGPLTHPQDEWMRRRIYRWRRIHGDSVNFVIRVQAIVLVILLVCLAFKFGWFR